MAPLPPTRQRSVPSASPHSSMGSELVGSSAGKGRRWLKRLGVVIVVLIAVVIGAFAALAFVAKQEIDDFVAPKTEAMRQAQTKLAAPLPGKATNFLVLGSDHRAGDAETDRRSDTMMLVRLDPKNKSISVLSFPRDLWIPIPGHGNAKINDAYALGGPALAVETLKEIVGEDINFVVDVDFKGFRGIVDTFDGIYVEVDRRYYIAENTGVSAIDIEAGYQRLMGRDALAFARHRYSDSDFHRIARQQLVLASLKRQIAQSGIAKNIPQLLSVLNKNTNVVAGGGDGVPVRVLYDYMRLGLALDSKDIYQIEYEGEVGSAGDASIVVYDEEKMKAAVAAFLKPSADAREKSASQLIGEESPKAEAPDDAKSDSEAANVPAPADTAVTVRNGSGVDGVAGTMAQSLRDAGYNVVGAQTNADHQNYANTRVLYRREGDELAAKALAAKIEGAAAESATRANPFDTKLLVIVGKNGTTVEGGEEADDADSEAIADPSAYSGNRVPEAAEALVTKDPEYGRNLLAEVDRGRLQMPLLYPTARAQGSVYDEVKQYSVRKGKSTYQNYRLVGKTPTSGEYWGVQGTTWPDPPLLEGANREVVRGNRTYMLYFNGTKLTRVAWRQGPGVYWVSNTLLNKLSNETMLAIAESTRAYR